MTPAATIVAIREICMAITLKPLQRQRPPGSLHSRRPAREMPCTLPGLWADSSAERTGGATVPVTHTPRGSAAAERSRNMRQAAGGLFSRAAGRDRPAQPHRDEGPPLIGGGAS
ncbi:hypothetical protein GCM10010315_20170 [Streptomyces luteosporeus]|uniref:Uncharacterized protein n=1 Tax=Streptomyces luteosporeus TaxID=173856 RepID=A0ABP6G4B9_9ACTN